MATPKPALCEFCAFAKREADVLECRRFPPTIPSTHFPKGRWNFAITWPAGWCGEWKVRP